MDLLFVSPELDPFIKVGGIADGIAALARELGGFGHRVTVALPRFARVALPPCAAPPPVALPGARVELAAHGGLPGGVEVLLFEVPGDHERLGVYGDDVSDALDNVGRWALFTRAVVALVAARARAGAPFDVVHGHDWPAAMVPYLLREGRGAGVVAPRPRIALTVHNLAHQGIFPREALALFGLGPEHFASDRLEFYGRINLLKGGILAADIVTTVSPTYAREILTPEHGELLEGVLGARAGDLRGILNGVDDAVWDPGRDPALPARYDAADPGPKAECKRALLGELGLGVDDAGVERPLVVSLGRVVEQKGSDLLATALPALVRAGATVIAAGAGEPAFTRALEAAAAGAPGRAAYLGWVTEAVAHRLIAAADLVAMPSRYEPCGLVQLYAQRYGALPVVRRTGGLADTVIDADVSPEEGTGFLFEEATADALVGAVARAMAAMRSPRRDELRRRVMRLELGFRPVAVRYERLYRELLTASARRGGG
jgi:starch synthase